jgi:hypothetical protein
MYPSLPWERGGEFSQPFNPVNHLLLSKQQVLKSSPFQDVVDGLLDGPPQHTHGTIRQSHAGFQLTWMRFTKIPFE